MTPKEKAIELFCKMYGCEINTDLNDIYLINGDGYFLAKDCALIAVDETLNMFIEIHNKFQDVGLLKFSVEEAATYKFWQEVKQEIEKL